MLASLARHSCLVDYLRMRISAVVIALLLLVSLAPSQRLVSPVIGGSRVSDAVLIKIVKAEDARNPEPVNAMLGNANPAVRYRAALAAGRIGSESSIDGLGKLLTDGNQDVRAMAAFAIGEVESIKGSDAILAAINTEMKGSWNMPVLARLVETAGKIAAANPKEEKSKELGAIILRIVNGQAVSPSPADIEVSRLGLTALLRARPERTAAVAAKFLKDLDPRLRSDALNTLARLRAKEKLTDIRNLSYKDPDPIVRANAARVLSAAEDKDSIEILLNTATDDGDSRVRVSAIRALGNLKDKSVVPRLLQHADALFAEAKRSRAKRPAEFTELIEIANVLGRLLAGTGDERALKFLDAFALADAAMTPDISIARLNVEPSYNFDNSRHKNMSWHEMSTDAQVLGAMADIDAKTDDAKKMKEEAPGLLLALLAVMNPQRGNVSAEDMKAMPDVLTAYAKFKTKDLDEVLRLCLERDDIILRATAAGLMADRPKSPENILALKHAFDRSTVFDRQYNDAELATLDALYKLDKKEAVSSLLVGLGVPDHLVRQKAYALLSDPELKDSSSQVKELLENARVHHYDQLIKNQIGFGTKMGQITLNDVDYRRALSRKNGSVKAVLTTEKGPFTIVFNPEEAPLTVDNFIRLARSGYFNGLEVHRVVANFVMQDGDPRGDGNGGPGWSIRCEMNMLSYDRGAVGMALSGKDTGGSQWFVTHSPQPHLDGGYTIFGHVDEQDIKVVDRIVRGDKILRVKIIGR